MYTVYNVLAEVPKNFAGSILFGKNSGVCTKFIVHDVKLKLNGWSMKHVVGLMK